MKANEQSTKKVMNADEADVSCSQVLRLQFVAEDLKMQAIQKYLYFSDVKHANKIVGILGTALKSIAEIRGNGKPVTCKPGWHLEGDACVLDRHGAHPDSVSRS